MIDLRDLPARVQSYLGTGGEPTAQVVEHTQVAASFVRGYTRDVGFDGDHFVHPDLASVIVSATARSLANPRNLQSQSADVFSQTYFKTATAFTLAERAVLDRYRVRAR